MAARRLWVVAALLAFGCASSPRTREPDEYTGCGSDEHWRTFDDQEPHATVADATAPVVTQPNAGAQPATPKPVFAWAPDANDPGEPDGDAPHVQGPDCMNCCPEYNIGSLTTLHLPPVSGHVYDLQFFVGDTMVHRVVTSLQEWIADDGLWASWRGKTVALKIYGMALLRNDLKEGPFVATMPFTFSVTP